MEISLLSFFFVKGKKKKGGCLKDTGPKVILTVFFFSADLSFSSKYTSERNFYFYSNLVDQWVRVSCEH